MILDMGEAINILEMARDIIILSGRDPDTEIPIMITGLREGEKLHEELYSNDEELIPLKDKKIFLAKSSLKIPEDLNERIVDMIRHARRGEAEEVLEIMSLLLPGFDGQGGSAAREMGR